MELKHQLTPHLKHLRLSGILETLDARHRQAVDGKWSYIEFLERLLQDEIERREQKQRPLRLRRATLTSTKRLETFAFNFNPTLKRRPGLALAAADYMRTKRKVILCGPPGVGKSPLAQALGHQACRRGYQVLFVNADQLLQHRPAGRADDSLARRIKLYLRPNRLIGDDFGLKPRQAPGPSDLYALSNARYERGSLLLTANRPPVEWPGLFGDPLLAAAGIDRLCHRAEMIIIRGQSFRAQARQRFAPEVSMT